LIDDSCGTGVLDEKHELPQAFIFGLKEIPRKRDGVLEDWIGWNRLLVGDDRTYGEAGFIPSLASKRSRRRVSTFSSSLRWTGSYGNGKKALYPCWNTLKPTIRYESLIEWQQVHTTASPSTTGWSFSGSERVPVEAHFKTLHGLINELKFKGPYQRLRRMPHPGGPTPFSANVDMGQPSLRSPALWPLTS